METKLHFPTAQQLIAFLYFKVHQPKEESLSPSQKSPKLDTKFSSPSPHSSTVKVSREMQSPNQRYECDLDIFNDYLVQLVEEDKMSLLESFSKDQAGELGEVDTSKFTPVCMRNAATTYYKDIETEKGHKLGTVSSALGEFLLIPNEDFEEYLKIAHSLPVAEMFSVNPALLKFAFENSHYEITSLTRNVWLLPSDAADKYRSWMEEMKDMIQK